LHAGGPIFGPSGETADAARSEFAIQLRSDDHAVLIACTRRSPRRRHLRGPRLDSPLYVPERWCTSRPWALARCRGSGVGAALADAVFASACEARTARRMPNFRRGNVVSPLVLDRLGSTSVMPHPRRRFDEAILDPRPAAVPHRDPAPSRHTSDAGRPVIDDVATLHRHQCVWHCVGAAKLVTSCGTWSSSRRVAISKRSGCGRRRPEVDRVGDRRFGRRSAPHRARLT
jgi:hypothetical protein